MGRIDKRYYYGSKKSVRSRKSKMINNLQKAREAASKLRASLIPDASSTVTSVSPPTVVSPVNLTSGSSKNVASDSLPTFESFTDITEEPDISYTNYQISTENMDIGLIEERNPNVTFDLPRETPSSNNLNNQRSTEIMEIEANEDPPKKLTEIPSTSHSTDQNISIEDMDSDSNDNIMDNLTISYVKVTETEPESINIEGRRVVDFKYFLDSLIKIAEHNNRFGCSLHNLKIVKEIQRGLQSTFYFKCNMCHSKFVLKSYDEEKANTTLNVNEGAVSGAILTGIGRTNLNEITASMDLPIMTFRSYGKHHDTVAEMWKTAAEESMLAAANEEIELARLRGDTGTFPKIPVEADCCWSKRSYKNQYNALSGVAAIVGHYTGKVLYIGVRNKYCGICFRAKKRQVVPTAHKCTKNHDGSSSSMEPNILVEGFKSSVEKRKLIYNTLIADGDASTYKNILESRPYPAVPIQKIECTNHLLRNYNGKNLFLKTDTTIPLKERKLLTPERLVRLRTAVRAAVRYWKTKSTSESSKIIALQKYILNSPKHIFGDHSDCNLYYCTEDRKKEKNDTLTAKTLMLRLQRNASQLAFHSRSLLHCFTTNRAEQFNSVVAKTVGGKRINFSLKDSYSVRCHAAVVCFNTGKPQTCLYKSVCNKSPGKTLKRLEQRKFAYNENRRGKTSCRKINFAPKPPTDLDYGNSCQKPDLNSEDYERAKSSFLESLQKQATKRHEIERETILQAESALWLELRRCILTASNFSKICKRKPNSNTAPLVKRILYSYSLDHVASVKHGKDNEVKAFEQLSRQENISIEKCGLFIDESLFFLGASLDGIYEDGIIEIKCPFSVFGIDPDTAIQQKNWLPVKSVYGRKFYVTTTLRAFHFLCLSLSLLGGLTMPEWKGRVPLTRSHCERIT